MGHSNGVKTILLTDRSTRARSVDGKTVKNPGGRSVVLCHEPGKPVRGDLPNRCGTAAVSGFGGGNAGAFRSGGACLCADKQAYPLVARTPEPNVSEAMGGLHVSYSRRFNWADPEPMDGVDRRAGIGQLGVCPRIAEGIEVQEGGWNGDAVGAAKAEPGGGRKAPPGNGCAGE